MILLLLLGVLVAGVAVALAVRALVAARFRPTARDAGRPVRLRCRAGDWAAAPEHRRPAQAARDLARHQVRIAAGRGASPTHPRSAHRRRLLSHERHALRRLPRHLRRGDPVGVLPALRADRITEWHRRSRRDRADRARLGGAELLPAAARGGSHSEDRLRDPGARRSARDDRRGRRGIR